MSVPLVLSGGVLLLLVVGLQVPGAAVSEGPCLRSEEPSSLADGVPPGEPQPPPNISPPPSFEPGPLPPPPVLESIVVDVPQGATVRSVKQEAVDTPCGLEAHTVIRLSNGNEVHTEPGAKSARQIAPGQVLVKY